MRDIKVKTIKRKGTIPRRRIRAAIKAVLLREAQEAEIKAQVANAGKEKRGIKAK